MHMSVFPACTYMLYVSGIHGVWRCQVVVSHHVNRNPLLQKRQVFSQLSHLSNQIDSFKSVSQTILGRKNYGWLFLPWGIVLIRKHLFASYTDCCWLVDNLLTVCQLSAFCYLFFCWFCCCCFFRVEKTIRTRIHRACLSSQNSGGWNRGLGWALQQVSGQSWLYGKTLFQKTTKTKTNRLINRCQRQY